MTTIVVDKRVKKIYADTQNTATDGSIYRANKIDILPSGRIFLGSGHCHSIKNIERWVYQDCLEEFRPDFSYWMNDSETYGSTCLVIDPERNKMWLIDDEFECLAIEDEYYAIGSGGIIALGAMDAGAEGERAIEIASGRDGNTSAPINIYDYGDNEWLR